MRRLLLLPLLAVAACGGDDEAASDPVATDQVKMVSGNEFEPRAIRVKAGTAITWTNEDSVPHNAVSDQEDGPRSELFGKGKTYSFTPREPGTIEYVCTVHPGMDGTITVE